jgi:hypothetical protein
LSPDRKNSRRSTQVREAALRELAAKRLRVQQAVEELIRRAHGGDFDDPLLAGLKQQLQEEINEALGIRVIDDVIITDLKLTRKEGQVATVAETAGPIPSPDFLSEGTAPGAKRRAFQIAEQ